MAFVADPQLVDPHTYPGRPWPLSTLTVMYTDQYLRRAFSLMQTTLKPDSLFFLGDLFDGGREWATSKSVSPEKRYRRYGDKFWHKEYDRFGKIFFAHWNDGGSRSAVNPRGRKLVASLPGNHDLGFGNGIQEPVHNRYRAYFGSGNRVDVVGNHTFVSVDTVSLSAMDQPDPDTGSSGMGSGDGERPNARIWMDTENFLNGVKDKKARAEIEELRVLRGQSERTTFRPGVYNITEDTILQKDQTEAPGFPTILLTHVPLYRKPKTPCGPLRERYPPSSSDPYPEEDERNSIKVQGGYQYQNVLTQTISNELISKVGPDIAHIYSGDDHDYCEIAHREFSGSPKEITVKSLSWAMGVRRPGFLLASLWNPIDVDTGKPIGTRSSPTLQNHLCLLPDQLGVFIQYAYLFVFTILVLLIRSIARTYHPPTTTTTTTTEPTLPLSEPRPPYPLKPHHASKSASFSISSSTTSSPAASEARLSSRSGSSASASLSSRQTSPQQHDAFRPAKHAQIVDIADDDDDGRWKGKVVAPPSTVRRHGTVFHRVMDEFVLSVRYVARVVLVWYVYLVWTW